MLRQILKPTIVGTLFWLKAAPLSGIKGTKLEFILPQYSQRASLATQVSLRVFKNILHKNFALQFDRAYPNYFVPKVSSYPYPTAA